MPRPRCCRRVAGPPGCRLFKPAGIPASTCDEVLLGEDELEAIRLADLEGFYQEQAAERMHVSRQTFGRIIESARRKVAQALTEGKVLRIEGGDIEMPEMRTFNCYECQHVWELPHGSGRPHACPNCGSRNFHRAEEERGQGRRLGGRARRGRRRGCGGGKGQGQGQGRRRQRLGSGQGENPS